MANPIALAKIASTVWDRREILAYMGGGSMIALFGGVGAVSMMLGGGTTSNAAPANEAAVACGPDGCQVSGSEQAAAQTLVSHMASGKLQFHHSDGWSYGYQVEQLANGNGSCGLALPILQLIEIACNMFDSVGITDLNRACTGVLPGGSGYSAHWVGRAIDFSTFNGTPLTGYDEYSIQYIRAIEPLLPDGSQVGQADARQANGNYFPMRDGISQIADAWNHLHVDVGRWTTAGLNL